MDIDKLFQAEKNDTASQLEGLIFENEELITYFKSIERSIQNILSLNDTERIKNFISKLTEILPRLSLLRFTIFDLEQEIPASLKKKWDKHVKFITQNMTINEVDMFYTKIQEYEDLIEEAQEKESQEQAENEKIVQLKREKESAAQKLIEKKQSEIRVLYEANKELIKYFQNIDKPLQQLLSDSNNVFPDSLLNEISTNIPILAKIKFDISEINVVPKTLEEKWNKLIMNVTQNMGLGEVAVSSTKLCELIDEVKSMIKKEDEFKATDQNIKELVENEIERLGYHADLNHIDVSNITSLKGLFEGVKYEPYKWRKSKFKGDISKWDVSNVKDMSNMFQFSEFNGDISKWDVSKVENMQSMFENSNFNRNISRWETTNVRNMDMMFMSSKFNEDISNWDVSNVKSMNSMFADSIFNKDISNWDVSNVMNMKWMFMESQFNGDISNWDVSSVEEMDEMFMDSVFNGDISNWVMDPEDWL